MQILKAEKIIIDAHSHVQFPIYDSDRDAVIRRARAAGVKMIAVGTQAATSEAAIKLAHQYPEDIWATAGFHPNHLSEAWFHDKKEQKAAAPEKFDINLLRQLAKDSKVAAIGECGLDYFRLITNNEQQITAKKLQKEVFLEQVELAKDLQKPLMIHCRPSKGTDDAYEDLLKILNPIPYTLNPILHFYVGGLEITKKLVAAGFYFTFGGVITFARDYDEAIKYIPLDRILLETDCPYVAPLPYRGKRNEPAYIIETAKRMAELKSVEYEVIARQTTKNLLTVFGVLL